MVGGGGERDEGKNEDEESRRMVEDMEEMNAQIGVGAGSIGVGAVAEVVVMHADRDGITYSQRRGSHDRRVSSTRNTTGSSGWSWWGPSAVTASASASASAPVLTATSPARTKAMPTPGPNTSQRVSGHEKTASRNANGSPRLASPRVNVSRDGFRRNVKSMNRIMGLDGGGLQDT